MKNLQKFSAIIFTILLVTSLFSCEDEDSELNNSKCLINKITCYENGEKTSVWNFIYDENNRLIKLDFGENGKYRKYFYNNNGNLKKSESYDDGNMWNYKEYDWSGNTVICKFYLTENDTTIGGSKEVREYNDNKEIIKMENYSKDNDTWHKTEYYNLTWQEGNLTKVVQYTKDSLKNTNKLNNESTNKDLSNDFTKRRTRNYTYDNNNNPFSSIHALKIDGCFGWGSSFSKNNRLTREVKHHIYDSHNMNSFHDYEYNNNNYPIKFYDGENYKYELTYDCN